MEHIQTQLTTIDERLQSWLKIKNLPLDYWIRKTFEAIGAYFGGLKDTAFETLNLLNCLEAKIQVQRSCVALCLQP